MSFFPRLDYMDFRQEGHRLEFKDADKPDSELEYKGVVYNEMKGAMSDTEQAFVHHIHENLFTKSQYRFNSGGDPKHIPELEYNDLVAFHRKYYHPSNCTFFSYGDLDFRKHLEYLKNNVLHRFDNKNSAAIIKGSEIPLEERFTSPVIKEVRFMPDLMSEAET